jgi:PAS domain S-box-containing protein
MNLKYSNLTKKVTISFVILSFILSIMIVAFSEIYFMDNIQSTAISKAISKSKEREQVVLDFIEHSTNTLKSIRESNVFQNYLYSAEENIDATKDIFFAYSKAHSDFMKIRFIDKDGVEKIKISKLGKDYVPYLVSNNNLQNKSHRYYFKDSKTKQLEKVWFSPIDLNIENGKVDTPYRPTLRAILPIDKNGEFGGILVINYCMQSFIEKLTTTTLYKIIIFDNLGYTIYHNDCGSENSNKSFGNSLPHKYNISYEFKNSYRDIILYKEFITDSFVSKHLNVPIDGGFNMILELKDSYLNYQKQQKVIHYIVTFTAIFSIFLLLGYITIRVLSNTIFNLDRLEKLNQALNNATNVAQIGFWEFDGKNNEITWSKGVCNIFESTCDNNFELTYKEFLSYLPLKDERELRNIFAKSIIEKREYFFAHRIITAKNSIKYVQERGKHYYDKNGNYTKTVGSIYDITHSYIINQKYKLLLENASDGVVIIDFDGNIVESNKMAAKLFGYMVEEEFNELTVFDLDKNLSKDKFNTITSNLIDTPAKIETIYYKKNGSTFFAQLNAKVMYIENASYIYASIRDVTIEKNNEEIIKELNFSLEEKIESQTQKNLALEKEKYEYQKKAAMGDLIGIIAHQLKQPLNIISLSIDSFIAKYDMKQITDNSIDELESRVIGQVEFMSDSIDDFRNFFRPDKKAEVIYLNKTIEKTLSIIGISISSKGIEIIKEFKDDLQIKAIDSELQQVIINILTNAKDVLLERNIENPWIKISSISVDNMVILSIEDNAGGVPIDIINKIFDSYFTTKGKYGTGIGLNLVKMIVENSFNAKIDVENTQNGAKFNIYFKDGC